MSLKLYYDFMSQPSRALYILLKTANSNFTPKRIDLGKGEHTSDKFTAINRFRRVPVIDYNGFILTESVAIIKYLSRENLIPDSLYPKDNKLQARVDEYLEWQHIGLRFHCYMYFKVKYLDAMITGKTPSPSELACYEERMLSAIELFDTLWVGQGREFVTGDSITVADLLAAVELEQPRIVGFDPSEKYKNTAIWFDKVKQHFSPHYEEAHVILNKVVEKQKKLLAKQ